MSSILISEVKDTKSQVMWALWKILNKKTLKCNFEIKFNNFQERKNRFLKFRML